MSFKIAIITLLLVSALSIHNNSLKAHRREADLVMSEEEAKTEAKIMEEI